MYIHITAIKNQLKKIFKTGNYDISPVRVRVGTGDLCTVQSCTKLSYTRLILCTETWVSRNTRNEH